MLRTTYIYIYIRAHTHRDLLENSPLPLAFTWAGNKRQRGAFFLEQTDLSWFAKPLDFGHHQLLLHHRAHFPSAQHTSTSALLAMPQAPEMQVCYGPKATQHCFCRATANLTYPVLL